MGGRSTDTKVRCCYHEHVVPIFGKMLASVREMQILAALRETLLPRLISGELRVKDTENIARRDV